MPPRGGERRAAHIEQEREGGRGIRREKKKKSCLDKRR